jgi:hypothetical protein
MNFNEICFKSVDWSDLVQDSEKWQALVNMAMHLPVPQDARNFLTNWGIVQFSRKVLLHRMIMLASYVKGWSVG